MKLTRNAFCSLAALLALLLAASCNNSFGAFSSIKREVAQSKTSDFKQTTVADITRSTDYYYAVMATVYARAVGGGDWSSLSLPGLGTSYYCTGIASNGTSDVFVAATASGSNVSNIYYSNDAGHTWAALGSSGMNLVVGGNRYDQVDGIWLANGTLYVQAQYFTTTGTVNNPLVTYSLFYTTSFSSPTFIPATGPTAKTSTPVTAMAAFSGSDYCAYGSTFYKGTLGTLTTYGGGLSSTIRGLKNSGTHLLAWTDSILYGDNGGAFAAIASPSLSTDNFISDVQEVPVGAATHLLVGTGTSGVSYTANGYWETTETAWPTVGGYVAGDSGSIAPSGSTSTYSTLFASKPVVRFFYDGSATPARLFAGLAASGLTTSSYGLVSITNSGGAWDLVNGWSAE